MSSERLETRFAVINQSKEEKSNEKENASQHTGVRVAADQLWSASRIANAH
jgi:hypothetical protein